MTVLLKISFYSFFCRPLFIFLFFPLVSIPAFSLEKIDKLETLKTITIPTGAEAYSLKYSPNKLFYLPFVQINNGIEFLNESGVQIKFLSFPNTPFKAIDITSTQEYLLIHSINKAEAVSPQDKISVYDKNGRQLWSTHASAYGQYYLAPSGRYAISIAAGVKPVNPPAFLDATGVMNPEVFERSFLKTNWPTELSSLGPPVFSWDSSLVAIVLINEQCLVGLFNNRGKLISLNEPKSNPSFIVSMSLSPNNNYLVIQGFSESQGESFIEGWNIATGNRIWEHRFPLLSKYFLQFSTDSKSLVFAGQRVNRYGVIEIEKGSILWEKGNGKENQIMTSNLEIVNNMIGLEWFLRTPGQRDRILTLVRFNGENIKEIMLPNTINPNDKNPAATSAVKLCKTSIAVKKESRIEIFNLEFIENAEEK